MSATLGAFAVGGIVDLPTLIREPTEFVLPREMQALLPVDRAADADNTITVELFRCDTSYAQGRLQGLAGALEQGWVTVNEARRELGLVRIDLDPGAIARLPRHTFERWWIDDVEINPEQAHARGYKLLREWLSPAQLAQYDGGGRFEVVGGDTGKRYRIRGDGLSFNVQELDEGGNVIDRLCFQPSGYLVPGDVVLAQKIALESNETATLKVANRRSQALGFGYLWTREMFQDVARRWGRNIAVARPIARAIAVEPEPVHPRSWLANWGTMGRDHLADRRPPRATKAQKARAARRR